MDLFNSSNIYITIDSNIQRYTMDSTMEERIAEYNFYFFPILDVLFCDMLACGSDIHGDSLTETYITEGKEGLVKAARDALTSGRFGPEWEHYDRYQKMVKILQDVEVTGVHSLGETLPQSYYWHGGEWLRSSC